MPKEIISVQAEDGSLHPDMLSAVRHETTTNLRRDFPELKALLDSVRFNNVCLAVRDYANMLHEQTLPAADTTLAPEPPGEPTLEDAKLVALNARRDAAYHEMMAGQNRVLAKDFLGFMGFRDEEHFRDRAMAQSIDAWEHTLAGQKVSPTPIPPSSEPRWMGCGAVGQAKLNDGRLDKVDPELRQPVIDRSAHD